MSQGIDGIDESITRSIDDNIKFGPDLVPLDEDQIYNLIKAIAYIYVDHGGT